MAKKHCSNCMAEMGQMNNKTLVIAAHVVNMFDQADTGSAIREHGMFSTKERRKLLIEAIDDLRKALKGTKNQSIFPDVVDGRPT